MTSKRYYPSEKIFRDVIYAHSETYRIIEILVTIHTNRQNQKPMEYLIEKIIKEGRIQKLDSTKSYTSQFTAK